jgi:hypothetical protein
MKINLGERDNIPLLITQHHERRQKIIETYKFHLPHIESFIFFQTLRNHKFSVLTDQIKELNNMDESLKLNKTIIDIRNNLEAVSPESNCVLKSDNRYSNEIKSFIKILLRKGWSYDEVVHELERIYGTGILSTSEHFGNPHLHERIINGGVLFLGTLLGFKFTLKCLKFLKRFV